MHEPLDLKALDHLERKMPRIQGHVWITQGYVDYIGDSLRPLLDLVEKMGEALETMDTVDGFTSTAQCAGLLRGDWKELRAAREVYRRAKDR